MKSGAAIAITLSLIAIGAAAATAVGVWRWTRGYALIARRDHLERRNY